MRLKTLSSTSLFPLLIVGGNIGLLFSQYSNQQLQPSAAIVVKENTPIIKHVVDNGKCSKPTCIPSEWSWGPPSSTATTATALNISTTALTTPIWAASFPGSGSDMFLKLIQAVTGCEQSISAIYNANAGCRKPGIVACKTHWPVIPKGGWIDVQDTNTTRAFVLIRHPLQAFPSYASHEWEFSTNTPTHSQQAPLEYWKTIRKKRFHSWIKSYQKFVQTWDKALSGQVLLVVVPYQDIISPTKGPPLLARVMTNLLHEVFHPKVSSVFNNLSSSSVRPSPAIIQQTADCLWRWVVQERASSKRKGKKYVPSFTLPQQEAIIRMLERLSQTTFGPLQPVMEEYLQDMIKEE